MQLLALTAKTTRKKGLYFDVTPRAEESQGEINSETQTLFPKFAALGADKEEEEEEEEDQTTFSCEKENIRASLCKASQPTANCCCCCCRCRLVMQD